MITEAVRGEGAILVNKDGKKDLLMNFENKEMQFLRLSQIKKEKSAFLNF